MEKKADEDWDKFFCENLPPANFKEAEEGIQGFCELHRDRGVVLVTSGGTTVPLELNTGRDTDKQCSDPVLKTRIRILLRYDVLCLAYKFIFVKYFLSKCI